VVENSNDQTKISATLGYTLNLGNFQSLRVDLGVVDHVREGESTKDAMDRVYTFVEAEVIQKVQDAREALVEE
jgi:hypothetical protein